MRDHLKQNPSKLVCGANQEFRQLFLGSTPVQQSSVSVSPSAVQSVSTSIPQTSVGVSTFLYHNLKKKKTQTKKQKKNQKTRRKNPQDQPIHLAKQHTGFALN